MPSLRDIRRRIRSVRNTAQITKAMELVAASRMRRAQQRVVASRPYAGAIRTMMAQLAAARREGEVLHPLLQQRPVRRVGLVLVTTDRGLCGPLNANIIRRAGEFLLQAEQPVELVTVGRKGQDFMARRGYALRATFTQLGDRPEYMAIVPIARVIIDDYERGTIDAAYILYPRFVSTLVQRPQLDPLLPITPPAAEERDGRRAAEYIYEPDPATILGALLPRYVEVQIYQAVLETIASEHSARMIAMRNATDNAKELIQTLTLTYNKARQAAITREVTEIASAAEALAQRE
ncbi:MAG TPA: ATP synthase F1 subunit gamma [Chloroflexota bacterium]|nr:ATP synthase F1 subunit gamma [Chloroflexota bacterium]